MNINIDNHTTQIEYNRLNVSPAVHSANHPTKIQIQKPTIRTIFTTHPAPTNRDQPTPARSV